MKKRMLQGLSIVLLGGLLVGCGNKTTDTTSASGDSSSADTSKAVEITAVGSTALQPLVDAAQEAYTESHSNYTINVQGGGSGTGLKQVSDGSVTIGNSDVFAEEKDGIDASALVDHKVAVVGMAPVTNKDTGVKDIKTKDLIKIFTGEITNWKELGGADQDIVVINRAEGSGTRATFEKWGLEGATPIKSQEQDSSGTVKKIVQETPGAISYLAFSYFDDTITALSLDGVAPTAETVADNSWKIWAYEHMYTKGEPTTEVKAFLDYILSDEVQDGLVKDLDYLPVTMMKVERDSEGTVKDL